MNFKVAFLLVLVVGISIEPAAAWFGKVGNVLRKAGHAIKTGVSKAATFAQNNPQLMQTGMGVAKSMMGDEEFLDRMQQLNDEDQDAYADSLKRLETDMGYFMTEDEARDFAKDFDAMIAMDEGFEKSRAADELESRVISAIFE